MRINHQIFRKVKSQTRRQEEAGHQVPTEVRPNVRESRSQSVWPSGISVQRLYASSKFREFWKPLLSGPERAAKALLGSHASLGGPSGLQLASAALRFLSKQRTGVLRGTCKLVSFLL